MEEKHQCEFMEPLGIRNVQCEENTDTFRDGAWLCWRHDEHEMRRRAAAYAALVEALTHLLGVIDAHELESLDCDRSADKYCDCLELAVKQSQDALEKAGEL